jgi:hypothetical protein
VENLEVKIPFYKQLGSIVKPQAIFGSNTSSLKIADFARPSGRPEKFVSLLPPLQSLLPVYATMCWGECEAPSPFVSPSVCVLWQVVMVVMSLGLRQGGVI